MAYYAALVSLLELLKEICHHDKYPDSFLDKQQIASLYEKLSHLQNVMGDYSPRDQEVADCLERRIRDIAYHARDIIEYQISDTINQRYKNVKIRLQQLENVIEDVDSIVEDFTKIEDVYSTLAEDLKLNSYISNDSTTGGASKVHAKSGTSTTVIFDEHLMTTLKGQLCGESDSRDVVSVVGMGGLGKSTLARSIFYDKLIHDRFDCRAWVSVSQVYHFEKVHRDILSSLKEEGRLGEAPEDVYKYLKGRRYLIVIDDIWDTNVWDDVNRILPDDSNGSRVIITTRESKVAVYAGKSRFIHQMQFLNKDQSWTLLQKKVFAQEHCPEELEVVGKLIAINCRGLPLAIVVIAGLLSKVNKTRQAWDKIASNVSSADFDQNEEHLSKILSLSYNHLPHHLKSCFLFMGGYPEDYYISVRTLVERWVAEGFLKPVESKNLEQVGHHYLEDLISRNLILVTKRTTDGNGYWCTIHDLLRDLCKKKACYENFLHTLDGIGSCCPEDIKNARRLYINIGNHSSFIQVLESASHIRSILFINHWKFLSFTSRFKLLRILYAPHIEFKEFPFEILELFHLRYLYLHYTALPFPPSISKLQNLQNLYVYHPDEEYYSLLYSLPCAVWKMPHLRHIYVCRQGLSPVPFLGHEAPPLENLQTLLWILNFKFSNEAIDMIPNLQTLGVVYFNESREKWQEYGLNNFVNLYKLETLGICFDCFGPLMADPLPNGFAFPKTLEKLTLRGCRLPWEAMTAVGSLPNLQVLRLRMLSFVGEEWEPVEGEFPRLKYLEMSALNLKDWRVESTHFPCLEKLVIMGCLKLEEIPPEIGEIPTLELIEVQFNELLAESALRMLDEQRDQGNEVLQVSVYSDKNFR